ncbi:DUF3270 domain-containing protein [Streptococcus parauberis]|uniref:DUF3270 domain-containing protein n=1 Tax=Streptococcus parauberis TaxID=1348 RepID=UPI000E309778|nr:DUF3270 domain-containing protein [Streptococcus parauberis]RFE01792.1 hypothetical protein ADO06_01168 [Streptococcus parauberis]
MPSPLRKEEHFEQLQDYQNETPKFQEFQELNAPSTKLEELFFFAAIAIFSLVTVLFAFVLLALNFSPIWAFLFSGLISFSITNVLKKSVKNLIK